VGAIKRRYMMRESEKKGFLKEISKIFNIDLETIFGYKPKIEIIEVDKAKIFVVNDKPILVEFKDTIMPTLLFDDLINRLPKVVVDMGAVPHICNGADIMAPGIVRIHGEFREGDLVLVLDEKYGKAIAIAKAMLSSGNLIDLRRGKVLKNIHYVGDSIWKAIDALWKRKS